jgi:hypothetical protein
MSDATKGCACKKDTFREGDDSDKCAAKGDCDATKCTDSKVCGWDATAKKV